MSDSGLIRLLHSAQEVAEASQLAMESFLHRLEMGGLTVSNEIRRQWWPKAAHERKGAR